MPSMIRLICPNLKCRKILTVPQTARGKVVRCPNCGIKISIPASSPKRTPSPSASNSELAPEPEATSTPARDDADD